MKDQSKLSGLLKSDLSRLYPSEKSGLLQLIRALLTQPGFVAVFLFRFQSRIYKSNLRKLAGVVRVFNMFLTGADFVPGCAIARGLIVTHPSGLVVGKGARIGMNCTLSQGVTLGEKYITSSSGSGYPTIGSNCRIGAGAVLLGKIYIGDNSSVGANSVVLNNIPADSTAVGAPARILS